jgi:ketosteroid isomerase-like protein
MFVGLRRQEVALSGRDDTLRRNTHRPSDTFELVLAGVGAGRTSTVATANRGPVPAAVGSDGRTLVTRSLHTLSHQQEGCALVDEPNAAVVQKAYEALSSGDGAAFLQTLDENVVWHESTAALAGTYRGRDEVGDLFGRFMQEIEGLSMDLHDILATRDHAVVLHTTTWSRKGRTATLQYADVYHVGNGKITEHWHLAVDPRADDEFWS